MLLASDVKNKRSEHIISDTDINAMIICKLFDATRKKCNLVDSVHFIIQNKPKFIDS